VAEEDPVPALWEPVDDSERLAAVARLHDLVGNSGFSLEEFSATCRPTSSPAATMRASPASTRCWIDSTIASGTQGAHSGDD
jgi:hypothetical protein